MKHIVTTQSSNSSPRFTLKGKENIHPHKHLYTNIHSSIIIIAQKWIPHKCSSTDEWINKIRYIHTVECYLAIKRNEVTYYNMDES